MKTIILSLMLVSSMLYSQDLKKGTVLVLKTPTIVDSNTIKINDADDNFATHLSEDIKYIVIESTPETTKLKAHRKYRAKSKNGKLYNAKIYSVLTTNMKDNFKEFNEEERISIGIISLPFKYRPQEQEGFETEFNINTTLNIHLFSVGRGNMNFQFGTGFGSIRLDEVNSTLQSTDAVNAITLGFLGGPMFRYKKIQYGFYTGIDIINNNSKLKWSHNGKFWYGLGIGFKLFTLNTGD